MKTKQNEDTVDTKQPEPALVKSMQSLVENSVKKSVQLLRDKGLTVGFAESCTGGLLSSYFTELAGVSDVFMGSVISYDNAVKKKFLKVSEEQLKTHGAVSLVVAKQMSEEVQRSLDVNVAIAITGVAGPSGGTAQKPVGTVFIAVTGLGSETKVFEHHFNGDRKQIQLQSCIEAIKHLNEFINN